MTAGHWLLGKPDRDTPDALADAQGRLDLLAGMMRGFAQSGDFAEELKRGLVAITERLEAEASSLFLLEQAPVATVAVDAGSAGIVPTGTVPTGTGSQGPGTADVEIVCSACAGPVDVTGLRLPWGKGVVGQCIAENRSRFVAEVRVDPAFAGAEIDAQTGFQTRSILVAPLSVGAECLGAIEVINKRSPDHRFSIADGLLLEALAGAAALAINNMRLTAGLVAQERIRRELELAAAIQRDLLPPLAPAGFPIHGLMRPMYEVSGDFFHVLPRADGCLWFCVGDVSGKGMNAALLMARCSALFRCLAKQCSGPGELLQAVNVELAETASQGMFVTLAAGLYDPGSRQLRLASAGHEPALWFRRERPRDYPVSVPALAPNQDTAPDATPRSSRDQETGITTALLAQNPPLGIARDLIDPTLEDVFWLDPGDGLFIFTDGLTEARNAQGQMPTTPMIERWVGAAAAQPGYRRPEFLLQALLHEGYQPRDDITLLAVAGPAVSGLPTP